MALAGSRADSSCSPERQLPLVSTSTQGVPLSDRLQSDQGASAGLMTASSLFVSRNRSFNKARTVEVLQ